MNASRVSKRDSVRARVLKGRQRAPAAAHEGVCAGQIKRGLLEGSSGSSLFGRFRWTGGMPVPVNRFMAGRSSGRGKVAPRGCPFTDAGLRIRFRKPR